MDNNIPSYESLLKILYAYYEDIKDKMKRYFYQLHDESLIEINFNQDFSLSNQKQNSFMEYNKKLNRFIVSIPSGTNQYNYLANKMVNRHKSILGKYENYYYSYFFEDEVSQTIQDKNIDFIEFIKSEFLYAYIQKIMFLKSNKIISYQDEYGEYQEKVGFSIYKILVEVQTRIFARDNQLFYLPKCLGNRTIIRSCYFLLKEKDNVELLLNDSFDTFLDTLPYLQSKQMKEYETKEFEKKFGLSNGTLSLSTLDNITYRSSKMKRQEYIDILKLEKENIVNHYLSIDS